MSLKLAGKEHSLFSDRFNTRRHRSVANFSGSSSILFCCAWNSTRHLPVKVKLKLKFLVHTMKVGGQLQTYFKPLFFISKDFANENVTFFACKILDKLYHSTI